MTALAAGAVLSSMLAEGSFVVVLSTLTVRWDPLIVTVTPLGMGTGALPIRDSLHSVIGFTDRKVCTRGCCCLKAPTRPVKLLCMQCMCVMSGRQTFAVNMQSCSAPKARQAGLPGRLAYLPSGFSSYPTIEFRN